jgi:hypothetical protein
LNHINKILSWLQIAGVKKPNNIELPEKSKFNFWYRFMLEELEETKKAYEENNITDVIDGVVDLQWVHVNLIHMMGIEDIYQKCFDEVTRSNFSKFCKTEQEARESVESYRTRNIESDFRKVDDYFVVFRKEDGKILKSIKWSMPDITDIPLKNTQNK